MPEPDLSQPQFFRSRPPTAVYPDRRQAVQYREDDFPVTASDSPRVFCINLEGGFFGTASLMEMILPIAQAIHSGAYGRAVLVVESSDDATIEFLESVAQRHSLSFFVHSSAMASLSSARPVGALTKTDAETLELLRSVGGETTSAALADIAGIQHNAAVNRLAALSRKHLVHRLPRGGREGDIFSDPRAVAERMANPTSGAWVVATEADAEFVIPDDIRASVRMLGQIQGVAPSDVLMRAWHEFIERHHDTLDDESRQVGAMVKAGDTNGLAAYTARSAADRAERAVARHRRDL